MLWNIWGRATTKWRSFLVYVVLDAFAGPIYSYLAGSSPVEWFRIFTNLAGLATGIFCLIQEILLLTTDRDGDENWPPIWSSK